MNAKLDPQLLRATSAEHAVECGALPSGARRLELIDETTLDDSDICLGGVVTYRETRWERLDCAQATVVFASAPCLDRVGVTAFYAGKYVSYHECSPAEAREAIGQFQRAGFNGPKAFEVKP